MLKLEYSEPKAQVSVSENLKIRETSISIIIPTLNEETYIDRVLRYLMESFDSWKEVIVVDGGSRDKTTQIAMKYPEVKVITYMRGKEYGARNCGAEMASGRYLLFLDADTIINPSCFKKIHECMRKFPDLACISMTDTPAEGRFAVKFEWFLYNLIRYVLSKLPRKFARFMTTGNFILVRKDVFEKVGKFKIDINGDGILGRTLMEGNFRCVMLRGNRDIQASCRRSKNLTLFKYNKHYLYALENYFYYIAKLDFFKRIKSRSWIDS